MDFITKIFGGTYNKQFDNEYGSWFGATGLLGIICFIIFYKIVYQFEPRSISLIISLLLFSFGNTLFFNLLNASILIPLFIIILNLNYKNKLKTKSKF